LTAARYHRVKVSSYRIAFFPAKVALSALIEFGPRRDLQCHPLLRGPGTRKLLHEPSHDRIGLGFECASDDRIEHMILRATAILERMPSRTTNRYVWILQHPIQRPPNGINALPHMAWTQVLCGKHPLSRMLASGPFEKLVDIIWTYPRRTRFMSRSPRTV
jgi:hypothetical protein